MDRSAFVLRFELDETRYGLLATDVVEVVRAATPATLPDAPPIVVGVLNVRGDLIPVYDVRARFSLHDRPLATTDAMILVRTKQGATAAIAVDRALDLVEIEESALREAPAAGARHVGGVAALADGTLVILELATFLHDHEQLALDGALERSRAT
jgi:purine-binding chemotaxis protein CheW